WLQSVNALWSPLNAWLIAPFIRLGYDAWLVAKCLNIFFGAILLFQLHGFFRCFGWPVFYRLALLKTAAVFLSFAVYFQVFGDVLQLVFVLLFIRILISDSFPHHIIWHFLGGAVMGIAYYAKAYSMFYFLVLNVVVMLLFYIKKKLNHREALIRSGIGISTALLFALPLNWAIYKKYGEFSITGLAGKLNMSWYIQSGKSFRSDIHLLIPPVTPGATSFWEDPFPTQQDLTHPLQSVSSFIHWIARVIHTCLNAVLCMNEISFLALAILLAALYTFFIRYKIRESYYTREQVLTLSACILPLGYLMMHIETRYIWLEVFLTMILGTQLFSIWYTGNKAAIKKTGILLLASSYLIFPLVQTEALRYKNKDLFDWAAALKQKNWSGRFTSNATDAGRMWVLAYLTHSSFYTIEKQNYSREQLLSEMKHYQVPYYFFCSENNLNGVQPDTAFNPLIHLSGLDVLELK
ncbi:MAG TPA: hypothetical protein PLP14_06070, partial [Chitinophagaceae bacterium]|nr:hypothetical protein [Chitinophagaceae bacterium]